MSLVKRAGRFIGYILLRGCLVAVPFLPLPFLLWLGRRMGDAVRILSRRRRRIADRNLRIAYGSELSPAERRAIADECFRQFGMFVFECMKFACMTNEENSRYLEVEPASAAVAERAFAMGRGVVFVSGHFGNFELGARSVAASGRPVVVVVRPARDARTTALMDKLRRRNGMIAVRRDVAAKPMVAALRRGNCVALLADQNAGDVFVPFFGKPTGTVDGPARLALVTGAPIVVGICVRLAGCRYQTRVEGMIVPDRLAPRESEVIRITSEINRLLETAIRRNPEQWLWFHDRWRSSPGAVEEADDPRGEKHGGDA